VEKLLLGRTVVLGVTGSIAAYKAADIVRRLTELGAEVHATITRGGLQFVTPVTLRTLSGNPVTTDMFAEPEEWSVKHVSLAQRASAVLVAPASANAVAKLALGLADEFVYTLALASRAPLLVAPAMNDQMYGHPAMQENVARLRARGAVIIEPEEGWLACGTIGRGRLASPDQIVAAVVAAIEGNAGQGTRDDFRGRRVLVTAGPTREPIDPVRFVSNRSSGKMGYALAAAAARRGAQVTVVSGPVALPPPPGCDLVRVETAAEMQEAVRTRWAGSEVVIGAAAVADYTPAAPADAKMKRARSAVTVKLKPTEDIIAECGRAKRPGQMVVGFAAETEDLLANARAKLARKHLDLVVANDVSRPGLGFDSDRNAGYLLFADGSQQEVPEMDKARFAERVLDAIAQKLTETSA
jgi:phosphopantothenoylcysteine decarboxylase/phosphopantothenate--cysteine ligase